MSQQVKDDNSSLYSQRDSTSILSRYTGNRSSISQVFKFDRVLFISKVYEKVLRGSSKAPSVTRVENNSNTSTHLLEKKKIGAISALNVSLKSMPRI